MKKGRCLSELSQMVEGEGLKNPQIKSHFRSSQVFGIWTNLHIYQWP